MCLGFPNALHADYWGDVKQYLEECCLLGRHGHQMCRRNLEVSKLLGRSSSQPSQSLDSQTLGLPTMTGCGLAAPSTAEEGSLMVSRRRLNW